MRTITDIEKLNTIYIISKGRPQCHTARTLTEMNYPGPWFIVCGNNDETLEEYKADKERIITQIDALQAEAEEGPTVNTEALKQLKRTNFRGIYDGMEPDEKRRFWRAIIKVIWFDEERNINVEFL